MKSFFGSVEWFITAPKKIVGFLTWPDMAPVAEEVRLLRFQPKTGGKQRLELPTCCSNFETVLKRKRRLR